VLETDPDFEALHSREDFRKLLAALVTGAAAKGAVRVYSRQRRDAP
jgi:hypothetical protein